MSWSKRFTEQQANKADAERLRDTFAAAALTGYLASENKDDPMTIEGAVADAYRYADAMLRVRNGAADGCETVRPHVRGTVTQHCSLNFTLSDEERAAIEWFAEVRKPLTRLTQSHNREKYKDTLCGLLERLK